MRKIQVEKICLIYTFVRLIYLLKVVIISTTLLKKTSLVYHFILFTTFFIFFKINVCASIIGLSGKIDLDSNGDGIPEVRLIHGNLGLGKMNPGANLHVTGNAVIPSLIVGGDTYSGSSANLNISGSLSVFGHIYSSNSILNDHSIVLADTSTDNLLLTLPYSGNMEGRIIKIKKVSKKNILWIKANGGAIDSYNAIEVSNENQMFAITLLCSNGKWYIINEYGFDGTHVLTNDITVWYSFDEISGVTAIEGAGSGNNATFISPTESSVLGDDGLLGNGVSLNGIDEYLDIPGGSDSVMDVERSNFTISVWFRASSSGRIFHSGSENFDSDHVTGLIDASGNLIFSFETGGGQNESYIVSGNYRDEKWHHLVGVRNGLRTGEMWVDGVLVVNDTDSSGTNSSIGISTNMFLGQSTGGFDHLEGEIDDFRMYLRELSDSEINLLNFTL